MYALSHSKRKEIQALDSAKGRRQLGAFLAEGTRCVLECLPLFSIREIFATPSWLSDHPEVDATPVEQKEIDRISRQQNPQGVLAVLNLPEETPFIPDGKISIALDAVQDPGNLGTIIRLADWFGITDIIAGQGTADAFAPKVVQATMGALGRVRIHRVENLAETLSSIPDQPIIGTFLDGADLYCSDITLKPAPIIVMGNEGNGISSEVEKNCSCRIKIPSFPPGRQTVESLNVAMATGIIVSELSRRIYG
ncbi:MAG: RNA methyltransferase [Muribaculaceae bacterium]|nr:RNA methyltransferase [Muribaculaceae bacterium]MDE7111153.1 RNA methyltransferase [Muribaculaceae bacterium]